jgi:hypothetical protein
MSLTPSADARLREAYEELMRRRAPGGRVGCPAPDAILSLVERRGGEDVRLVTLDHVMACVECRRDLDLVRTAAGAAQATVGAERRPWSSWSAPVRAFALAATVVIAVGLGIYMRTSDTTPVMRGGAELSLHEGRRLAEGTLVSWRPAAGATRYDVAVIDADGRQVLRRSLTDTSFVLVDSIASAPRGVVIEISAALADGSTAGPTSARLTR